MFTEEKLFTFFFGHLVDFGSDKISGISISLWSGPKQKNVTSRKNIWYRIVNTIEEYYMYLSAIDRNFRREKRARGKDEQNEISELLKAINQHAIGILFVYHKWTDLSFVCTLPVNG